MGHRMVCGIACPSCWRFRVAVLGDLPEAFGENRQQFSMSLCTFRRPRISADGGFACDKDFCVSQQRHSDGSRPTSTGAAVGSKNEAGGIGAARSRRQRERVWGLFRNPLHRLGRSGADRAVGVEERQGNGRQGGERVRLAPWSYSASATRVKPAVLLG